MTQGEVRQRKSTNNKKKVRGKDDKRKSNGDGSSAPPPRAPQEPETLWETFRSHPLVMVTPYIAIPYFLWRCVHFFALRRPDILVGLFPLRPAVQMHELRQVLILGSIASGTKQVTEGLSKVLKLEVSHESTNSLEVFTRDGTASNFLGIRYASVEKYGRDRLPQMLTSTCLAKGKTSGSVFHLEQYQPTSCWPRPLGNKTCRQKECINYVGAEFGCGLRHDHGNANACSTPFARTIHLVRHPVHALQQLLPQICPGGAKAVHPSFRQMAGVFLPDDGESCLATVAWYLVEFNRALLEARREGLVHAMVRYENTTLCGLAEVAGFADPRQAVYAPNVDKVTGFCSSATAKPDAHKAMPELETKTEDKTVQLPAIQWDGIKAAGGSDLLKAMKDLTKDLGYDPNAPLDFEERYKDAKEERPKASQQPNTILPPGEVY